MRGRRPETSFATAVAAFGQTLRGDALMKGYSAGQIESLAGKQTDYWRQEFLKLVDMADSLKGG